MLWRQQIWMHSRCSRRLWKMAHYTSYAASSWVKKGSSISNYCVLQSVGMLRNITTFHTLATASVERTAGAAGGDQKITYNVIKNRLGDLLYKITSQKFEDPSEGEETIK